MFYLFLLSKFSLALQNLKYLQSEQASCLEGTRTYYWEESFEDGIDNFLIFFEGESWIQGFDQQEISSNINMSSSKFQSQTIWMGGLFNINKSVNTYFYNWNTIFVNYCYGTGHQ